MIELPTFLVIVGLTLPASSLPICSLVFENPQISYSISPLSFIKCNEEHHFHEYNLVKGVSVKRIILIFVVRIVGGRLIHKVHPWVAHILIRSSSTSDHPQCMGTLINRNFVLTAAHCVCLNSRGRSGLEGKDRSKTRFCFAL